MPENGRKVGTGLAIGLGIAAVAFLIYRLTQKEAMPAPAPEEEEEERVVDAEYRSGYVWWAALTAWKQVHLRYPNEWPADTDISLAWTIKNIGNVGAYFQVYMFDPGEWLYLDPGESMEVFERRHTQAVPGAAGYQFERINILARNLAGERLGAVWSSDNIEVTYV